MKSVPGKQLAKVLELNGWELLRVHGSHHIFGMRGSIVRLSVPIHGNRIGSIREADRSRAKEGVP